MSFSWIDDKRKQYYKDIDIYPSENFIESKRSSMSFNKTIENDDKVEIEIFAKLYLKFCMRIVCTST